MNTIFKIAKAHMLPRRPVAAALVLPRHAEALSLAVSPMVRRRLAGAAIAVSILSVAAYVAAVNAMLLAGEAMKEDAKVLAALEQEYAVLSSSLVARESPAWLESSARANGMVEAQGIRFLMGGDAVALSR